MVNAAQLVPFLVRTEPAADPNDVGSTYSSPRVNKSSTVHLLEAFMDPTLASLAAVALTDEGRRAAQRACDDLHSLSSDEWVNRHADLAEDVPDEPSEVNILIAVGERDRTIGWVDSDGEDDEHQVQNMVADACARLNLVKPAIPEDITDQVLQGLGPTPRRGAYVPALLHAVDLHLSAVGLRLLLIDPDSDTYDFVPVTADSFAALVGQTGDGYQLRALDPSFDYPRDPP